MTRQNIFNNGSLAAHLASARRVTKEGHLRVTYNVFYGGSLFSITHPKTQQAPPPSPINTEGGTYPRTPVPPYPGTPVPLYPPYPRVGPTGVYRRYSQYSAPRTPVPPYPRTPVPLYPPYPRVGPTGVYRRYSQYTAPHRYADKMPTKTRPKAF